MSKNYLFLSFMKKTTKNIKISIDSHTKLKKFCDDNGIKIYKFLEKLIEQNCTKKKDIYGED